MSSHSPTARHLSGHLWSGALLVSAAAIALAAERFSAPRGSNTPVAFSDAFRDVGEYLSPVTGDAGQQRSDVRLMRDPFEAPAPIEAIGVASGAAIPTVNASRSAQRLTAILIADDRPVAVLDGEVVNVGDVLPNGARVASIRADRVALLEKGGKWRVLTLSTARQ